MASVRAGFEFLTAHWRKFLPGAALSAFGAFIFAQALAVGSAGAAAIGLAAMIGTDIVYRAALFRFALRGEYGGAFGLRLSEDEGRLTGVTALYTLFAFLVLATAVAVVMVVVVGVVIATGDIAIFQDSSDAAEIWAMLSAATRTTYMAAILAVAALMLFVAMRLCLYAPATIAEQRIVLLESWPWTRDNFWRLLATLILAALPGMAVQYLFVGLAGGAASAGAGGLAALLSLIAALGGALAAGMMVAGALAFLYRGLRPPESDAA